VSGSNFLVLPNESGTLDTLTATQDYFVVAIRQGATLDVAAGGAASVDLLSVQQGGVLEVAAGGVVDANLLALQQGGVGTNLSLYPAGTILIDGGTLETTNLASIGGVVAIENGGAADLRLAPPTAIINGVAQNSGTIDIAGASSATLGYASGITRFGGLVNFSAADGTPAPGGTAVVDDVIANLGTFADFTAGDTIDLSGYASGTRFAVTALPPPSLPASVPSDLSTLYALTDTAGGVTATIATLAVIDGAKPLLNANNDTITACFAAGTRILTVRGEVAVDALRVGDLVATFSGAGAALKPVRWIGYRHVDLTAHPTPEKVRPVRMIAGCLAPGLPHRDLVLSPGHALCIDDHLVDVEWLLNGVTVTQDMTVDAVTYYHIELDQHDLVLAEGVFSETYLDTGNRGQFVNAGAAIALHPDFLPHQDKSVGACRPWLTGGPLLREIRARLIAAIEADGYRLTEQADLHLVSGGLPLRAERVGEGVVRFTLPSPAQECRLRSRVWIPGGVDASNEDMRRLGVRIRALAAIGPAGRRAIALDDPALQTGFYGLERFGDDAWRWTTGDAMIPAVLLADAVALELEIVSTGLYWDLPEAEEFEEPYLLSA
jgi:hypothetical protein